MVKKSGKIKNPFIAKELVGYEQGGNLETGLGNEKIYNQPGNKNNGIMEEIRKLRLKKNAEK